jgi:integrase
VQKWCTANFINIFIPIGKKINGVKKMYPTNLFLTEKYVPAELHRNKIWTVVYYVYNPKTDKLHRKVVRCNKIKNLNMRLSYARQLVKEINEKLASGWNPFFEQEFSKGFVRLIDALNTFEAEKKRELRADSMRSYSSYIAIFIRWLTKINEKDLFCISFTKRHALDFLTDVYVNQKISGKTYNNYIRFFICAFNWMIDHEYCKQNYFIKLKRKKNEEKKREIISPDIRTKIENYLRENNHNFLCITLLCYGCLIRPKEILNLKPKDFILDKQIINVPASVAKNGKSRNVVVPNYVADELKKLNLNKINPNFYVFSDNFNPGKKKKDTRDVGRYWQILRKILDIPQNVSFYSLKDSGISDLLDAGIPAKIVQQHADHSSIAMTEKYNHKNFELYKETITKKMPAFT